MPSQRRLQNLENEIIELKKIINELRCQIINLNKFLISDKICNDEELFKQYIKVDEDEY